MTKPDQMIHCPGGGVVWRDVTDVRAEGQRLSGTVQMDGSAWRVVRQGELWERKEKLTMKAKAKIDFDVPDSYIEWHVIDTATQRSLERCDEPDHALTHRAVADGTAYVVEATMQARILKHRIVTEDTIGEDE